MNLLKLFISFMCFECQASFLDSVRFRYPKPPNEQPQIKPKYNFTPIWSPVNASLTDEQYDTMYKVSMFSWTVFLFYFVNLKF